MLPTALRIDGTGVRSLLLATLLALATGGAALLLSSVAGWTVLWSLFMVALLTVALKVARDREGFTWTPVTLFFLFAVVHAMVGLALAFRSTLYLNRPSGKIYDTFDLAFGIVSSGVISMLLGYIAFGQLRRVNRRSRLVDYLACLQPDRVNQRARWLLAVALVTQAFLFWLFGEIPLLTDKPGLQRYIQFIRSELQLATWLQNRCFDIMQVTCAILLSQWVKSAWKRTDLLLNAGGAVAAVLAIRRGMFMSTICAAAFVWFRGERLRTLIMLSPLFLCAYLTSQYFLLSWDYGLTWDNLLELYGQGLPELRDLALFLASHGDQHLWGATLLYALIPLPSFSTALQQQIMLRSVTLNAIGLPLDTPHGGLRIFLAGEGYLNFGFPGVIVLGFGYGLLCGLVGSWISHLRRDAPDNVAALAVVISVWVLVVIFYLSGTGGAGVIRIQLLLLALLCLPALRLRHTV